MKEIRELAGFRSRRFSPILPEACQVKPRAYGAELAFWLAGKLARQGVVTSYPVAGRLGWTLESDGSCSVLCANVDGSDEHWRIALACSDGFSAEKARSLVNAIRFVLHAAVSSEDIDWRYDAARAGNDNCRSCKQMPRM
jgi:hypothetical protein